MTNQEFSDSFDVLYNNITNNQAPGIDEYEKSIFLTKAQDEIIKAYFDPTLNKSHHGFDQSKRRQIDFSMLIKTGVATEVTGMTSLFPLGHTKFFAVPDRIMMFINESLEVQRGNERKFLNVVPLDDAEYARLMSKPFKRPIKNQAWRIITNTKVNSVTTTTDYGTLSSMLANKLGLPYSTVFNSINNKELEFIQNSSNTNIYILSVDDTSTALTTTGIVLSALDSTVATFTLEEKETMNQYINKTVAESKSVVELVPGPIDNINTYTIRYIARPRAIILSELEGVTIDNQTAAQSCELDEILHQEILQRAVELAKAAYMGDLSSQIALGQASETNMGIATSK